MKIRSALPGKSLMLLALFVWTAGFIALSFSPDLPQRSDDTLYLALGKSFAQGEGYSELRRPVPTESMRVPSAFPALLAVYWLAGSPPPWVLKGFIALLLTVGILLSFVWLTRFLPHTDALLIAMAFAASTKTLMIGNSLLTEALFIPLLYGCLLLLGDERNGREAGVNQWLGVLVLILLARTRFVGLAFAITYGIVFVLRRRWGLLITLLVSLAGWMYLEHLWVPGESGGQGYVEIATRNTSLSELIESLLYNYRVSLGFFANALYARILFEYAYHLVAMNPLKRALTLAIFAAGVIGLVSLIGKEPRYRVAAVATLLSWVPVFTWRNPWTLLRYLYPFTPFLVLPFFHFLRMLRYRREDTAALIPRAALVLIVVNQVAFTLTHTPYDPWEEDRESLKAVHRHVVSISPRPDLILSPQPNYTFLTTGIHSLHPMEREDICRLRDGSPSARIWWICRGDERDSVTSVECQTYSLVRDTTAVITAGAVTLHRTLIVRRLSRNHDTLTHEREQLPPAPETPERSSEPHRGDDSLVGESRPAT